MLNGLTISDTILSNEFSPLLILFHPLSLSSMLLILFHVGYAERTAECS